MIAESLQLPLVPVKSAVLATSGIPQELFLPDTRSLVIVPNVTLPIVRDFCSTLSLYASGGDLKANLRLAGESFV